MALKSTWRRVDELEADKQDALVSGVNIKTVNGNSLLGSGDLPISGGGGISDGDKGDITVSGSGTVWTIDNLAVNNAKINDVAATKVTQDTNHRFVTDAEKSTYNLKQDALVSGTNLKTLEGQSLLGSGNIDLTKSDVGLSNVDNTSDLNKPISTATQTALNAKEDTITAGTTSQYYRGDKTFQTLDKTAVGLSNVDNTSDVDKPVSTAQATAIGLKQDTLISGTNIKTIGGSSILGAGNLPIPDPAGWTTIVKSANQNVTNSATLVTDTDLQFSVVAGGHYMIEMDVVFSCNNTSSDYKNAFNVSAGTMSGKGFMIGPSATAAAQVNEYAVNAAATTTTLVLGSPIANLDSLVSTKIIFSFMASANATFRYQFSQNVAIAATTARTWKGSILKYKRID